MEGEERRNEGANGARSESGKGRGSEGRAPCDDTELRLTGALIYLTAIKEEGHPF